MIATNRLVSSCVNIKGFFFAEFIDMESFRMQEAFTGSYLLPTKRQAEYTDPMLRKMRKKSSARDLRVHCIEPTPRRTWSMRTGGRLQQSVIPPVAVATSKLSGKVKGAKGLLYTILGIV
jgi:hypothetical protein